MNRRGNYAGGYVSPARRARWRAEWPSPPTSPTVPWPTTDTHATTPEEGTMKSVQQLLAELETTLAAAEELRYRIQCELRQSGEKQPAKAATAAYQPAQQKTGTLDTSTLVRTGRGLWAWASEWGHTSHVTELGRAASFPARTVDWNDDQVNQVVDALEQLLCGAESAESALATARSERPHRNDSQIPY